MHPDPITGSDETHRHALAHPTANSLGPADKPSPIRDDQTPPEVAGPNWPVILTATYYSILAGAAYCGYHEAILIGSCYLGLAALVAQVHKRP